MYKGIPGDVAICVIMVMIMMFAPSWIDCYDFKCPEKPHRKIRANWLCNLMEENYSCMLDLQQTTFKESCSFASDFVRPGQKYVISGRRKNMNCSNERYQPFRLYSSELSTCVFEKSSCSAEGQIIFSEGSTKEDRTCRCDYSRGYTFLSRPKDLCYCTPNEADCSCYIAACPESRSLSTDYECKADFQSLGICKPIEKNGKRHPYDTTAGEREFVKSSIRRKERNNISIKVMLLITVMLVSFCCILIIVETDTTQTATTSSSNKDIPLPKKRIAILQMLENLEANLKMEEFNSDIKETFWNDLQEILTLTYPNASYKCILQCAKRDLARNDCSIIVTGETSAGKTTVIKQLVGQKLFHTKNVTTAPTVCKIRNSKQLILKAYRKESGDITTIYDEKRFENLKQMKVAIQRLIDNCHEDGEIKDTVFYTDISCPVPILKENVIIVDTPGIEESTDLDDILIDLLPEAVLLIFVVNARGIHKERMSTILKTILRNTDNMICFDPLDGFFLTYDDDDDNSENEILEELKKHWPTVKEDRIFKIKPSQSGSMEDNFYIKDCERFGACLREFIIRNHNKQAESYVSFILDLTENAIKLLDDIKDEKDKLIKQDSEKIRELEDNKDKYIENLHNHKKTLLDEVTCLILDYLKSTTAHDEILNPKEKPSIVKIDFDKIEAELRYRLQNAIKKYLNGRDVEEKVKYENEKIRSTCDKIPLEIKKVEIYKTEIIFELPLEQIKCSYGMEYKRSLHVELLESYSMYAVTRYNHLKYRLLGEKKRLKKAEKRLTYMISNIQKNELKTIAEQSIGKDYNNDVVSIFKDIILEIDRMKATKETMKGECDSLNSKCSSIRTLHNMLQNLKL